MAIPLEDWEITIIIHQLEKPRSQECRDMAETARDREVPVYSTMRMLAYDRM